MVRGTLLLVIFFISFCPNAKDYRFVSIEGLVDQKVGKIVLTQLYTELGLNISITPMPGRRAQQAAFSGQYDGEIMRIFSYGGENTTNLRVPTPYYSIKTTVFVRKNSGIRIDSKADLKRYRIAKERGIKHSAEVTKGLSNVMNFNSTEQMMISLLRDRADVAITSRINGLAVLNKLGLADIEALNQSLATFQLYHYIHQSNKQLVPKIDRAILAAKTSGQLDEMLKKAESVVIRSITARQDVAHTSIGGNRD